jgi:N-acetylmuramoyl-L-alanine amidase
LSLSISAAVALGLAVLLVARLAGQPAPAPLTLLAPDSRRALPVALVSGAEVVALDDLASAFQLAVREEAGAITVSYSGRTVVLPPDQALASVAGRLISLPAPPSRVGGRWMVPLEFINRALAPIYDDRIEFRRASRLVLIGDLRVPRVVVRHEALANASRLTIETTPPSTSTVAQEPGRLAIRFDADALDLALPPIQPQGLVQAVGVADAVTLSVDLGPRFASFRAATQTVDNTSRLVVDVLAAATETTAAPPAPVLPSPTPPAPPDLPIFGPPAVAIRTIVIDPGHGGDEPGARGADGTVEKDLTLAVARRLRTALEGRLGVRVLLTRDDDRTVPIETRTAVANNNKADLFLSLHANASVRPEASGASVYVAAFDERDHAATSLGRERVPVFGGTARDIEIVLWDLAQTRHVMQSTELARVIEQQFQDRIPLDAKSIDSAPFRILESANMPAVLIEMGYLTNGAQERLLSGAGFQNTFVQAVFEGIVRFRDFLASGSSGGGR